jgi:hypothetical protein
MEKFTLTFKFVNGNVMPMHIDGVNYDVIAEEIMNKNDRWFGRKGDLINLDNVISIEIMEAH